MVDQREELTEAMIDLLLNESANLEDFRDDITCISSFCLPIDESEDAPLTAQGFVVRFENGSAFCVTIENHPPGTVGFGLAAKGEPACKKGAD